MSGTGSIRMKNPAHPGGFARMQNRYDIARTRRREDEIDSEPFKSGVT